MTIRIALACCIVLAACKDKKEEAKPTPVETKPAPTEAPKPTETPTPVETQPAGTKPTETKPVETKPLEIKPAGGFKTQADYETKANDLMDKLMKVFQSSGANCDKLADALNKFADANKTVLEGADEFEKANPEVEKQLQEKMKGRQQEVATKMGPSMQACQNHKGVRTAMERLDH